MLALCWNGQNLTLDANYRRPEASDQMALVRVRFAGICSTDLQILKGYMGFQGVPGHEFVGEVHEGPPAVVGKRVVAEINFACGNCKLCAQGLGRHCTFRRVMGIRAADGSFSEYLTVPTANLHCVPDGIEDEEAVFTEPLAAALEILEQVQIKVTDEVTVLGDGKLGLLCAQVLHVAGARTRVIGKNERKLRIAQELGIEAVLLSDWKSQPADIVVEATGSISGLELAICSVRPRGVVVLKSTVADAHRLSLAPLVINEITVIGSRCGLFPPALRALATKSISVIPLIDEVYPLAAGTEAVAHAERRGTLKILLRCG